MKAAIDWLQQLGTSENDAGNAVVVDRDNNYIYATGYNSNSIGWVAKFYAKSGEQIWSKQLSDVTDASDFTGSDIAIDDDNVYVLIQDRENDKTLVTKRDLDTGEEIWTYDFEYDSGATDECSSIVADGSGYLYVTGTVAGSMISPDDEALESTGVKDAWIAKLSTDTDKELNWIKQFGSSESESYGMDLAVDGSGNIYAVGYTTGVMIGTTDVSNSESSEDIWIAKYNSDGERQWIEQLGSVSNENERALAVAVDEFGGVYATGFTKGDLYASEESNTTTDNDHSRSWVAKFQAITGEQVWLKQFGYETGSNEPFYVEMRGISVDNNGGVYIAGWTDGEFQIVDNEVLASNISNNVTVDPLIVKYSAYTGNPVWLHQITQATNSAYNMTVGSDGSLYVTGLTEGIIYYTEKYHGKGDIWLAQLREVPEDYDELAQVLKRYIDYKVSQSTETVLETSETTSDNTTTTTTTSSLLAVAAGVVNSGGTEGETEPTTVSENSPSVLSVAASLASS